MSGAPSTLEAYIRELRRVLPKGSRARRRFLSETEDHLAEAVADEQRAGYSREQAERRALARFGSPDVLVRELNWSSKRRTWLPAVVAICLLAIGIGVMVTIQRTTGPRETVQMSEADRQRVDPVLADLRQEVIVPARAKLLFRLPDPTMPVFYRLRDADGANCIMVSWGIVGSCMRPETARGASGTVTAIDDIEGSGMPVLVYGQIVDEVTAVHIDVAGTDYSAQMLAGVYLFQVPDPALTVDSVRSVSFTLANGSIVVRSPHGN